MNRIMIGFMAAVTATAMGLSACSHGSSTGTQTAVSQTGLAAAQALVDKYSAKLPASLLPAGTNPVAKNKFIVTVPCSYAAENCKLGVDAFAEAAKSVGWTTKMIDPAGNPDAARTAIRTAINLKANGIFFMAADGRALSSELAQARTAGLVTVNVEGGTNTGNWFNTDIQPSPTEMGQLLAARITVESKGHANVLLVNDPEFSATVAIHDGLVSGLNEFCPSCRITTDINFQIADLSTGLPAQFAAALAAHPDTNYVWASYDAAAQSIKPAIKRSSSDNTISMVSTDGLQANLTSVRNGDVQTADVAASSPWQAYQSLDVMNTLFKGGSVTADLPAPYKLITRENLTTIPWDGDLDWKSAYATRWGLT